TRAALEWRGVGAATTAIWGACGQRAVHKPAEGGMAGIDQAAAFLDRQKPCPRRVGAGKRTHPPPSGVARRASLAPSQVQRCLELCQASIGGRLTTTNAVVVLAESSVSLLPIFGGPYPRRGLRQRDMPLADLFRCERLNFDVAKPSQDEGFGAVAGVVAALAVPV